MDRMLTSLSVITSVVFGLLPFPIFSVACLEPPSLFKLKVLHYVLWIFTSFQVKVDAGKQSSEA